MGLIGHWRSGWPTKTAVKKAVIDRQPRASYVQAKQQKILYILYRQGDSMKAILGSLMCLVAINLMFNVNASTADDAGEDSLKDSFVEYYSYFQGTWKVDLTEEGETQTSEIKIRGSKGGCNVVVGEDHTAIWGFNPKSGQWAGVVQMEDGSRSQLWITKPKDEMIGPGTTFKITGSTVHTDGTVTKQVATFTCNNHNQHELVIKRTTTDGKALPDIVRTATRIDYVPMRKRFRLRRR